MIKLLLKTIFELKKPGLKFKVPFCWVMGEMGLNLDATAIKIKFDQAIKIHLIKLLKFF
jgi:hypothetical protein